MAQWLRIQHCHYSGLGSILGPGTSVWLPWLWSKQINKHAIPQEQKVIFSVLLKPFVLFSPKGEHQAGLLCFRTVTSIPLYGLAN